MVAINVKQVGYDQQGQPGHIEITVEGDNVAFYANPDGNGNIDLTLFRRVDGVKYRRDYQLSLWAQESQVQEGPTEIDKRHDEPDWSTASSVNWLPIPFGDDH